MWVDAIAGFSCCFSLLFRKLPFLLLAVIFGSQIYVGLFVAKYILPSDYFVFFAQALKLPPRIWYWVVAVAISIFIPLSAVLAELTLLAIAYAISAVIVLFGLVYFARVDISTLFGSSMIWLGLVAIPLAGLKLIKVSFDRLRTVIVLAITCFLGLVVGYLVSVVQRMPIQVPPLHLSPPQVYGMVSPLWFGVAIAAAQSKQLLRLSHWQCNQVGQRVDNFLQELFVRTHLWLKRLCSQHFLRGQYLSLYHLP